MTHKEYVRHYYYKAFAKDEGDFYIYAKLRSGPAKGRLVVIGEGPTEEDAWENAKCILENAPKWDKPYSIYFEFKELETKKRIAAIEADNKRRGL